MKPRIIMHNNATRVRYFIQKIFRITIPAICLSLLMCNTANSSPADAGFTKWHVNITMDENRQSSDTFTDVHASKNDNATVSNHARIDEIGYAPPMMFGNAQYHVDASSGENAQVFVRRNISVTANGTLKTIQREFGTINDQINKSLTTYTGTAMKDSDSVDFEYSPDGAWSLSISQGIDNKGQTQASHHDSSGSRSWSEDYAGTDNLSVVVNNESPDVKLTYQDSVFIIEGDIKKNTDEVSNDGGHHVEHNILHFRAVLTTKEQEWEAIILPQDAAAYHNYIPTGPDISSGSDAKGGNSIGVMIQVRNKKTHALYTKPFDVTYTLAPSREPGWCMNYPAQKTANNKPDFFFADTNNPGKTIVGEQLQLTSLHAFKSDAVQVTSRDYGAWGWVRATVRLADGNQLEAHALDAAGHVTDDGLILPEDTDHNHIADQWERDHGVMGKPSTADDEDDPSGMFNRGDGYDLYEEYRGFALGDPAAAMTAATSGIFPHMLQPKYQRLNPKKRELLISIDPDPRNAGLLMYGALQYQHATGITVLFVPSRDQLAPLNGDPDAQHPRWSNFNAHPNSGDYGPKQAAVWITSTQRLEGNPGKTPMVGIPDDASNIVFLKAFGSPRKTVWVEVDPKNCLDMVDGFIGGLRLPNSKLTELMYKLGILAPNWTVEMLHEGLKSLAIKHPEWHITVDNVETYAKAHRMELRDELIRFTVLHELGHATGARHHGLAALLSGAQIDNQGNKTTITRTAGGGDPYCPMRYWHYRGPEELIAFLDGKWDPGSHPYEADKWRFCDENWPTMRLHD